MACLRGRPIAGIRRPVSGIPNPRRIALPFERPPMRTPNSCKQTDAGVWKCTHYTDTGVYVLRYRWDEKKCEWEQGLLCSRDPRETCSYDTEDTTGHPWFCSGSSASGIPISAVTAAGSRKRNPNPKRISQFVRWRHIALCSAGRRNRARESPFGRANLCVELQGFLGLSLIPARRVESPPLPPGSAGRSVGRVLQPVLGLHLWSARIRKSSGGTPCSREERRQKGL